MIPARKTKKIRLLKQFGNACQQCGYNRCTRALQFHHHDSSEKDLWSKAGNASYAEIEAHPDRFMLLCANCHFEEHDRLDHANRILANCLHCGKQFQTKNCLLAVGKGKYCSHRCQYAVRTSEAPMTIAGRFWKKVRKTDSCWLWIGKFRAGHSPTIGVILPDGRRRPVMAARVSWELNRGPVPDGMEVIRTCQEPGCVNPDHLMLGTRADVGMIRKKLGYTTTGEKSGTSKVTEDQVREIRRRAGAGKVSRYDLAREFGLSYQGITDIIKRRSWTHI